MAESYAYTDLTHDEFRLIQLNGLDASSGRFTIDLENIPLNDSTIEYDAISYAWNNEIRNVPILCSGKVLTITASLHNALSTFSTLDQAKRIWADAICINQNDDAEKALQVPLMRQIYRNAYRVLVWLGSAGSHTDRVMDSMLNLNLLLSKAPDAMLISTQSLQKYDLPGTEDQLWHGIGELFARPWFQRLWIVQEVSLADNILVFCGSKSVPWEQLSLLAGHIGRVGLVTLARGPKDVDVSKSDGFDATMVPEFVRQYRQQGRQYPLLQLCHYARSREASEPIDKVYAMLGLTDESIRKTIIVDYSPESKREFWKAYVDLALCVLETDTSLFLVQMSSSQQRPLGLPSWCPNFNSTSPAIMLSRGFYRAGSPASGPRKLEHAAYLGASPDDKTRIKLRGLHVDDITAVVPNLWHWDPDPTKQSGAEGCAAACFAWMNSCRTAAAKARDRPEKHTEDLVRTLIANMYHVPAVYAPDRRELEVAVSDATVYLQILRDNERPAKFLREVELLRAQRYLRALDLACRGRRFFCTGRGRLGLGSLDVRVGDRVYVFEGAQVPFVFRVAGQGDGYVLIGEAYVHGIMDGECLRQDEHDSGMWETLVVG